jgi:hypothetical protein
MDKLELLKASDTRYLLSQYNRYRFSNRVPLERLVKGGERVFFEYRPEEIKAELDTRPHVPNKRESRGLRLQKIRKGI